MDARTNPELALTEPEIVYLEAHDIHCPVHAWQVIERAIAAKRADDYARKNGAAIDRQLALGPELSLLAGICQKITINHESRDRFKKLYRSAFARGLFDKDNASPARINPYK